MPARFRPTYNNTWEEPYLRKAWLRMRVVTSCSILCPHTCTRDAHERRGEGDRMREGERGRSSGRDGGREGLRGRGRQQRECVNVCTCKHVTCVYTHDHTHLLRSSTDCLWVRRAVLDARSSISSRSRLSEWRQEGREGGRGGGRGEERTEKREREAEHERSGAP